MKLKRLFQILSLNTKKTAKHRADYLRSIFGYVGENVLYQPRTIPLYPELIKFHNNIVIAAKVTFITHDAIHIMLNRCISEKCFKESIGCIEIMDNVFVGTNTTILYDVRIGSNVIIGANSLVNKDLESGFVYAGIPAKKICTFEDFIDKRRNKDCPYTNHNQRITEEEIRNTWEYFYKKHL